MIWWMFVSYFSLLTQNCHGPCHPMARHNHHQCPSPSAFRGISQFLVVQPTWQNIPSTLGFEGQQQPLETWHCNSYYMNYIILLMLISFRNMKPYNKFADWIQYVCLWQPLKCGQKKRETRFGYRYEDTFHRAINPVANPCEFDVAEESLKASWNQLKGMQ